jgi:hypothetical protein
MRMARWHTAAVLVACGVLVGCAAPGPAAVAGPGASPDAPMGGPRPAAPRHAPGSYAQALGQWQTPEDIGDWLAAHFVYDHDRAIALSETARKVAAAGSAAAIHHPEDFFRAPVGICVDLARFGVETLRQLAPALKPRYLMIEFEPATVAGHVLRRHWVATFERDGELYVFADSSRPGDVVGPYASVRAFVDAYAGFRGRVVVAHRALDDYRRQVRTRAVRQVRAVD